MDDFKTSDQEGLKNSYCLYICGYCRGPIYHALEYNVCMPIKIGVCNTYTNDHQLSFEKIGLPKICKYSRKKQQWKLFNNGRRAVRSWIKGFYK